jgi:hypothetical protein
VQFSQSTLVFFPAAFDTAEFLAGTTDDTTILRMFRCARNPEITPLESLAVAIREGFEIRLRDAKANFVYELLISINK